MEFIRSVVWTVTAAARIACMLGLAAAPASAEDANKYKPGDRVEVQSGRDWQPGVVVSVDQRTGLIEVRLDDDKNLPPDLSAELRKQALVRMTFADSVRRPQKPGKEDKAADSPNQASQARTWKDRTGKFSITATLQEVRDGNLVILERSDGKVIQVPLDKLSDDDAKYVRDLQAAKSPFDAAPDAAPSPPAGAKRLPPILREMQTLRPKPMPAWSFKPEPIAAPPAADAGRQRVAMNALPNSKRFFETVEGLYVSSDGRRAIVDRVQGQVAQEKDRYLEEVDLAAGKSLGLTLVPPGIVPLDASPADGVLLYRSDAFGFGGSGVLTVSRLQARRIVPTVSWGPYERERHEPDRDIGRAWILSRERVMTANRHGRALIVWDAAGAKALVKIPLEWGVDRGKGGRGVAISADRRWLAFEADEIIALVDLESCEQVAALPREGRSYFTLAFRDDNQQLCGTTNDGIAIWDLTTGERVCLSWHPRMIGLGEVQFAGPFVLMSDQYLFDPPKRILLWEYEWPKNRVTATNVQGGRLWGVSDPHEEGPMALISAPMPNPDATRLAGQLGTAEELLIAKAGDPVAIKVDVDPGIVSPDEIRQSLAASLAQAGYRVADRADLVVTAICRGKETQTIKINTGDHFRPRPQDIVERTITPHVSSVTLTYRGEIVTREGEFGPPYGVIVLNQGESLDQALDRRTQPHPDWIKKSKFQASYTRPGKANSFGAYGASKFPLDE